MHHIIFLHLMHCTMLRSAHLCSYTLGHVESEFEKPMVKAQVKVITNLALDQDKPRCI
jgi:hypothetical protein